LAEIMKRILALLVATLLAGCGTLPSLEGRSPSSALEDTGGTRLARAVAADLAAHPAKTGIYVLDKARDAFVARGLLTEAADRSLDVQYYIWRGDQTGWLLFEALWRAAERGVRVRLLLDDNGVAGLDDTLAALDAHPNIEVRLYNPFVQRRVRSLGYLTDFARTNRRMHNKSFTADGQVSIVGGRNIGNEYFGAGHDVLFADLDVIAVGPAVREVSAAFDLYWNSESAYPAASIVGAAAPEAAGRLQRDFAAVRADPESLAYLRALRETPLAGELLAGRLPMVWAEARVVRDDPAKTLDAKGRTDLLLLADLLRHDDAPVRASFDLISPYFVPGEEGTAALAALAQRGVAVRVLTNSFAATDVGAVHAGYIKRREDLLRAGVRLYELKPSAAQDAPGADPAQRGGSSSASLHAKTFATDRSRIFVGSFNFDQRSALLNTEMGLLIDSPALGQQLAEALDRGTPHAAYEVRLAAGGGLEWIERTPAGEMRHATEPGSGPLRRTWIRFLSVLPIEWLL
jgi:putative cardiolipin synthase